MDYIKMECKRFRMQHNVMDRQVLDIIQREEWELRKDGEDKAGWSNGYSNKIMNSMKT